MVRNGSLSSLAEKRHSNFLLKWSILVMFNGIRPSGSGHVQPVMTPLLCVSSPVCTFRVDSLDYSDGDFNSIIISCHNQRQLFL